MHFKFLFPAALLLTSCPAFSADLPAGRGFTSPVLQDPASIPPLMANWADFWERAYDPENGGYFTHIDASGQPLNGHKSNLIQARHGYGFTRAFMLTGDARYLQDAHRAVSFLMQHAFQADGRFVVYTDRAGAAITAETVRHDPIQYPPIWLDPNNHDWVFMRHYFMTGPLTYWEATRDPAVERFWRRLRGCVEELWDDVPGQEGYHEWRWLDDRPANGFQGKGFSGTVDGLTTHHFVEYLHEPSAANFRRVGQLLACIQTQFLGNAPLAAIGFPENFTTAWEPEPVSASPDAAITMTGHVFKSVWCLARGAMLFSDASMAQRAQQEVRTLYEDPRIFRPGQGPCGKFNWVTGELVDGNRNWWMMEQAILAGLSTYAVSGDPAGLAMADQTYQDLLTNFLDPRGELYEAVAPDNHPLSSDKGNDWKASYHSLEMLYYTYVYMKLFVRHEPITLYYALEPSDTRQLLTVAPCELPADVGSIVSVRLQGELQDWKHHFRQLEIPPNTTGTISVVFELPPGDHVREIPRGHEVLPLLRSAPLLSSTVHK